MPLAGFRNILTQTWPSRPTFTEADVSAGSQAGRVFIVTGGDTGIGFELCKTLCRTDATIHMASRSKGGVEEKAEAATKSIAENNPQSRHRRGQIKFLHLDLTDLVSVRAAAQSFAEQEARLDVLWYNAGTGAKSVKLSDRTAQGLEPMMGIHCVATLLFSELLVPQLKAAAAAIVAATSEGSGEVHVVWLSSGLMDNAAPKHGIDFDALDEGTKYLVTNYGASKARTWMLGREFSRRPGTDGILSVMANSGNLKAGVWAGTSPLLMFVIRAVLLHEPVLGAYTELYAGLSPEITRENNGTYIIPWGRLRSDDEITRRDIVKATTPEAEGGLGYGKKLWEWCDAQWALSI